MEFFNFLKNESETFGINLFLLFAFTGIINALIVGIIIYSLGSLPHESLTVFLLFVFSIVSYIYLRKRSEDQNAQAVEEIIQNIRLRILNKIRKAELTSFEKIDRSRYYTALSTDASLISEAAKAFSTLFSSSVITIIAFVYLFFLSTKGFFLMLALIGVAVLIFRRNSGRLEHELIQASEKENEFFNKVNHLMDGFVELKINQNKNEDLFHNYIKEICNEYRLTKIDSMNHMNNNNIFAQSFFYMLIGFAIFAFPILSSMDPSVLVQFVVVILFIATGPLYDVIGTVPYVERANVSAKTIQSLENELEQMLHQQASPLPVFESESFQSLECHQLQFEYYDNEGQPVFQIGPLDFHLKQGEIVFLMGGNGSGKSTFLKVITGLYYPTGGQLICNNHEVNQKNVASYRGFLSVILQDFHLFDRLYGVDMVVPNRVNTMLEKMELLNKTSVLPDGSFETIELSAGQKKRLGLIVSELEDRELYIFDEWAADQDPHFREYFYYQYLPELKQRGKTVLAVTHDEKYYAAADRLYKMDYGSMEEVTDEFHSSP